MSTTRRLAAILSADVAGYSRLIGTDEEGTLERLKAARILVIDPAIAEHHGRIVKTTGDGMLVEFASVIDALRCATEWQRGLAEQNAGLPGDRIEFRIGINVGDVVVEDGDIFGDGVNVASRLEALADPGGICVSSRGTRKVRTDWPPKECGEERTGRAWKWLKAHPSTKLLRPRQHVGRPTATAGNWAYDFAASPDIQPRLPLSKPASLHRPRSSILERLEVA